MAAANLSEYLVEDTAFDTLAPPSDPNLTTLAFHSYPRIEGSSGVFRASRVGSNGEIDTYIHEIGHALGLTHPFAENSSESASQFFPGAIDSSDPGKNIQNHKFFTVMSYTNTLPTAYAPWPGFTHRATPGAYDIAAIQALYGKNMSTNVDDTIYRISDVALRDGLYTIWDTGGRDAIAYDGTADAIINLIDAQLDGSGAGGGLLSRAFDTQGAYTIANGVVIEVGIGGSGNDKISGGYEDNVLFGRDGNDTLLGFGGDDRLDGGEVTCSPSSLQSQVESVHLLFCNVILLFGPCGAILPSRPHVGFAVARRGGQGRRFFSAAAGLSLTVPSTMAG